MKNFQFRHCFGALFLSLFILLPKHCFGQGSGVNVTLSIDTSNKNLPISLALQPNDRSDIVAIRVTLQSGKFVAFMPATDTISILPLSDRSLEIYAGQPDSLSAFEPAPGKTIFRFLTDSSTRDLDLDVELLNKNFQIVFQQRIKIAISIKFYLPGPCSQTFLSLSTGKNQVTGANYAPGTIDPYWSLTSVPLGSQVTSLPASVFVTQWIPGSTTGYWAGGLPQGITCLPNSGSHASPLPNPWHEPRGYYTYKRTFCANAALPGKINIVVHPYDSCSIYFNNQYLGGSDNSNGTFSFDGPFSISKNVSIISGINTLEVRLYRWKVDPNTFRIVGGITSNNIGDLGLTSDNCCSGSGGSDYGTISGHKYWDLNCNGIRENGEPGVANWTITLSRPGTPSQTNTTDANGWYSFTNLLPGVIYTVTESSKVGWFNGATSSYSLALGSGQSAIRDFLNCKKPECSNLLTEEGGDEECCQYSFNLSNGLGKLSKLDYTVTGGALKYIETESCIPTSVSPNITFASSSGTLSYVPSCNNSVDVKFGAYSTTASGLVCVKFKFTFEYGTGSFTCDTTICFQCDRMPKDCGDALKVIPHVFGSNNTDWHFFSVSNVKAPISRISSIDLNFFPPPTTGHIGGSSIATSVDPAGFWGIGSYAWTPANSGGPSAPYSKIRLNCSGNSLPHGPAASNSVWFQLGVDKLLNYNGSVQVKVGYCDGDTCEFIYRWIAPTNNGAGKVVAKNISSAPRIFSLDITPIDSTESFTVSIADTAASIIAISAPDPTELNTGNLFGLSGSVSGNSAMYKTNVSNASEMKIPTVNTNIVFVPSKTGSSDSTSIIIRYYGKEGNEIGTTSKVINTSKITTSVNQPLTNPAKGDVFINSIIPNPGSGTMTCTYSLGAGENARLELFNTLGQSVALISDSFTAQGSHQKSFNVTSLAEGIYHLRLTTPSNEAVVTVKVIH